MNRKTVSCRLREDIIKEIEEIARVKTIETGMSIKIGNVIEMAVWEYKKKINEKKEPKE